MQPAAAAGEAVQLGPAELDSATQAAQSQLPPPPGQQQQQQPLDTGQATPPPPPPQQQQQRAPQPARPPLPARNSLAGLSYDDAALPTRELGIGMLVDPDGGLVFPLPLRQADCIAQVGAGG